MVALCSAVSAHIRTIRNAKIFRDTLSRLDIMLFTIIGRAQARGYLNEEVFFCCLGAVNYGRTIGVIIMYYLGIYKGVK